MERSQISFETIALRSAKSALLSLLSLCSIQAAAFGPPSEADRAKMEAALQTACSADFTKLCPDAADHHEKFSCLRSNEANLSSSCSTFITQMKAHHHGPGSGEPPREPSSADNATSGN